MISSYSKNPIFEIIQITSSKIDKKAKIKAIEDIIRLLSESKKYLPVVLHKNVNMLILLAASEPTGKTLKKVRKESMWLCEYIQDRSEIAF